jgi:hypothetical protein
LIHCPQDCVERVKTRDCLKHQNVAFDRFQPTSLAVDRY